MNKKPNSFTIVSAIGTEIISQYLALIIIDTFWCHLEAD